MKTTRSMLLAVTAAVCLFGSEARGDENQSVAAATALFDEAVALMDKGKFTEACPKLSKSQEIAPSGGTLLALGECYERTGRNASAWLAFREAAARAASAGKKDAESAALERAARAFVTLSKLTVHIAEAATVQGVEVRRDGVPMKPAEIGTAVPLDPGTHLIEAVAPGHRTWSAHVVLASRGSVEVTVPALDLVTSGLETTPQSPPPEAPRGSAQRTIAVVVAGAGAALLAAGAVFGVMAGSTNADALSNCNTRVEPTRCNERGLELTDHARTQALLSTVFMIAGGAALVGGGVLWLTAPVRITPSGYGRGGGVSALVQF
jgi:hypothetical protein